LIPGLPQKTRATVFRLIVQRLQTDPVLSGVVKSWLVWKASPIDRSGITLGLTPAIRLTPQIGATDWYTPDSMLGPLQIKVELQVEGIDADDCLNLWEAIEEALYPASRTDELDWEASLRTAGAETGQVKFSQPASIQSADENQFLCIGQMSVDVIRVISP
jgi:hypothetical protein